MVGEGSGAGAVKVNVLVQYKKVVESGIEKVVRMYSTIRLAESTTLHAA